MLTWMRGKGKPRQVGVEGNRRLRRRTGPPPARPGHRRVVPRPDRRIRRQRGKATHRRRSRSANRAGGQARRNWPTARSKPSGCSRVARNGAKARTAALNTSALHAHHRSRSRCAPSTHVVPAQLVAASHDWRPDLGHLADPVQAAKHALRSLAQRVQHLNDETRPANTTRSTHPGRRTATSAVFGLGPDTVAALLIAIGDNPDRLRSEAAFAHLCGVALIPASSGKTSLSPATAAGSGPATAR